MLSITDLRAPWQAEQTLPIVFNHGIGTNRHVWSGWLPHLAPRHRCIAYDLRGYGEAPRPPADAPWRLDDLVADLIGQLDHLAIARAHLVGESVGGTIALAAAIRHPDRVASVAMSNAGYRGGSITNVAAWRQVFARDGVAAWNQSMMQRRFGDDYANDPALDQAALAWFSQVQGASDPDVTAGIGEMLVAVDLSEGLRQLAAPLLVLLPDASPFVPLSTGAEIKALQPRAEIRVFPGLRHGLPFIRPAECAAELLAFYRRWGF